MTLPTHDSLVAAGLDSDMADSVLKTIQDQQPVALSIWWMYDCHLFHRIEGATLDEIIAEATEIQKEDGYGMLCAPTLLNAAGKEVRRVSAGPFSNGAHAHGRGKDAAYWQQQCKNWRAACEADADVMRLLRERSTLRRQRP